MSGHSKWSQIKHQKGVADQKRGQLFSKLARAITLAAKHGIDPASNHQLTAAVERARGFDVPKENIERAIRRASEKDAAALSELLVQAIGMGGIAVVVRAITDNKNRTLNDIRTIFSNYAFKLAVPGTLNWMFDENWNATNPIGVDGATRVKLDKLFTELDEQAEVEEIYSNLTE